MNIYGVIIGVGAFASGALTGRKCQEGLAIVRKMRQLVPADVLAQLRGE